jgi:2-iminobutanoate/2-iminopropanoate deaminase
MGSKGQTHDNYSHVVIASGQSLVFIAGQLARDGEGRIVGKGDMGAQIRQVGENLRIALEAAGLGLKDLVKTTTYVTDIDEFFKHPEVRNGIFGQALPTSTTVEVRRLSHPDLMVEVEAMAVIDR